MLILHSPLFLNFSFFSMALPHVSSLLAFYKSVLAAHCGNPSEETVLNGIVAVNLFLNIYCNGTQICSTLHCMLADNAFVTLQHQICNERVDHDDGGDVIATGIPFFLADMKSLRIHTPPTPPTSCFVPLQMCTQLLCTHRADKQ